MNVKVFLVFKMPQVCKFSEKSTERMFIDKNGETGIAVKYLKNHHINAKII